ncbi:hypothetical protein [Sphingomicrobium astaxanthinifaciens]|uniref:hypothetical protein n=1 Tax=Sphingomicrobium astaxanthinifaciens TaxID=1227949 RepID=UPI001FCB40BC|nr:hypothetical protein [Sphingomicrobium astaxanthinifaciens]MCJ7421627.1 hypothetical protein [Sphingomicrobium astaxanthinifaciens]
MNKRIILIAAAACGLAACSSEPETYTYEIDDPMADDLAAAEAVDPASVPMGVGSDDYRCKGSNQLLKIDWIRTGEQMSARVTPQGERGMQLVQQGAGGPYTNEDGTVTMTGSPDANTVVLNGATCEA